MMKRRGGPNCAPCGPALGAVVMIALSVSGCGSATAVRVAGRVTVEGVPMTKGNLLFVPLEASGGATGGEVADGRYSVVKGLNVGKYRVEIRQPRPSSRMVPKPFGAPGEMVADLEEGIAEDANVQSTLVAIIRRGANTYDFDVRSKPTK